ncbi:MAG: hypothetical protein JO359_02535 [Candidatus Eremiobacteraeota bacterium]|nr:hypothetical protein [Candidatus Eremiobacteraeota bacterium]
MRAGALLAVWAFALLGASPAPQTQALLQHALDPNPDLMTYTASVTLSAQVHGFPPVHETLRGTASYRKPQRKIVFQNVPPPLKRFASLTDSELTSDELARDYVQSSFTDNGTSSSFVFVPVKSGARVKTLTLQIDDQTQLLERIAWAYTNGEALSFTPAYSSSGRYQLLSSVAIAARFPSYNVDGVLSFSNYQLGAPVNL